MMKLLVSSAVVATCHAFSVAPNHVAHYSTKLFATVEDSVDRRAFLASSTAVTIAAATYSRRTALAEDNDLPAEKLALDYSTVANDILQAVKDNPDWGPTLVRLAWHSIGTYDKMSKTGGSGSGSIRFKEELAHGGNAGLADTAVKWMEPIHAKYADSGLSYADLYTLAGGRLFPVCCHVRVPYCIPKNRFPFSALQWRPSRQWEGRRFRGAAVVWIQWILCS